MNFLCFATNKHCCIRVFVLIFYFLPPNTSWHTSGLSPLSTRNFIISTAFYVLPAQNNLSATKSNNVSKINEIMEIKKKHCQEP